MSETYLTIGSDTGHTEINKRTHGFMETTIDYSKKLDRKFEISIKRDSEGYYDFKLIDKLTKKGLQCKVKKGGGFTGSCKPIGGIEIES